mmetsp:Transcript_1439/g.2755  ORF Transcript_1439/g.2755 Transcript_1439/m.2755 type:complete len:239 (+) Transcript_1439:631-1347(+)
MNMLRKTFHYPLGQCTTVDDIRHRYTSMLKRLGVGQIHAQSAKEGELSMRCMYCIGPGRRNESMIAFTVDVSTESRSDYFAIRAAVTRFAGDRTLFERKAHEVLEQDPLQENREREDEKEPFEAMTRQQQIFAQMENMRYPCPRCGEDMKFVKKRPTGLGSDYANVKKHIINFCPRRRKEEKDLVKMLMLAKGMAKGKLAELTMRDIEEVPGLGSLHRACKTVTDELRSIVKNALLGG